MGRRKKGQPIHGWLVLDKPLHLSSTQALGRVRRLLDAQKGGHGGTLDPLATGILPLAFGEATKTLSFILDAYKTYRFCVTFGEATTTGDVEGEVCQTSDHRPNLEDIKKVLPKFIGEIEQTPPAYSALKVDGERAYKKARAGEEVVLKPRKVTIKSLKVLEVNGCVATFEAEVSKGTYIRTLGQDMAKTLGTCGHISFLRRVAIGKMTQKTALCLEEIEKKVAKLADKGHIPAELLYPVDWVLDDIPAYNVTDVQAQKLRRGLEITLPNALKGLGRAKTEEGKLLSLVHIDAQGCAKVARNFNL